MAMLLSYGLKMFEREQRYIVMKVKDMECLEPYECQNLLDMLKKINEHRLERNKECLMGVFVEDDWPEYEKVWEMIEERVNAERTE